MKLIKKILPITSLAAVAVVPFTTTSCSKVWEDMLSSQYQVNFDAEKAAAVTEDVATQKYFNYFKDHSDQIIPDIYWGISAYAREELAKTSLHEARNYLSYISYANIDASNHKMSFKLQSQIEVKVLGAVGGSSYSIDTYNLVWEIQNLQFKAHYHNERPTTSHKQIWTLCPVKFNIEEGTWTELTGDERIIFEFKTVKKGYGEDGAQNFIREISESAIVDEQHKYVPELEEVYTNAMLLETYYLSDLTKA